MNFQRAEEIFNATQSITVFHNGTSVWIEKLDPTTQTAFVRSALGPMSIPVSEMNEVH